MAIFVKYMFNEWKSGMPGTEMMVVSHFCGPLQAVQVGGDGGARDKF